MDILTVHSPSIGCYRITWHILDTICPSLGNFCGPVTERVLLESHSCPHTAVTPQLKEPLRSGMVSGWAGGRAEWVRRLCLPQPAAKHPELLTHSPGSQGGNSRRNADRGTQSFTAAPQPSAGWGREPFSFQTSLRRPCLIIGPWPVFFRRPSFQSSPKACSYLTAPRRGGHRGTSVPSSCALASGWSQELSLDMRTHRLLAGSRSLSLTCVSLQENTDKQTDRNVERQKGRDSHAHVHVQVLGEATIQRHCTVQHIIS